MVVETAPVIPGDEDSGTVPVLAIHDGIDLLRHKILCGFQSVWWVIALLNRRSQPGNSRPCSRIVHP